MKQLRIGFLLDDEACPQWQRDIIDRIQHSENLEICFFGVNGERKQTNPPSKASKQKTSFLQRAFKPLKIAISLLHPLKYGIPIIYTRHDEKHNKSLLGLWEKDLIDKTMTSQVVTLTPERNGFTHYFSESDLDTIKACDLDILIRFGFSIIRGQIHELPKYGVWSFHHGDNRFYRGGPPGIWELIKGKREIGVTLQRLNDTLDCGQTIGRNIHRADLFSVIKNKHTIYSSCGDLLLQKIQQIQYLGFNSIKNTAIYQETIPESRILKSPRNIDCYPLIKNLLLHYFELRWPRNKKIQWFLAIQKKSLRSVDKKNLKLISPPADRFYADPFLYEQNKKTFVFFEELIFSNKLGHISVGELNDNQLINIQPIIQENFHLSYPFIFSENDQVYLIPESRQNKNVRLYRCVEFPYRWELDSIILPDVELLDITLYRQDDHYFMFASEYNASRNTSNENLVVYFSKKLHGPWQPHPMNPLGVDITNSRPAGKLFKENDQLILPTQNCAKRYGHAINFNAIEISTSHFSMQTIDSLEPSWCKDNLGTHTWNTLDKLTIIDGHKYINT